MFFNEGNETKKRVFKVRCEVCPAKKIKEMEFCEIRIFGKRGEDL